MEEVAGSIPAKSTKSLNSAENQTNPRETGPRERVLS
jgi:hypothetical protein